MINLPPAHAPARSVWAGRAAAMSEPLATGEHGAVSLGKARAGLRAVLSRVTLPALLSTLGPRRLAVLRGDCATVEAALRLMAQRRLLAVPVVAPGPDKAVGREQAAGAAEGGSSVSPLEALGGDAAEVGGAAGPSGGAAAMAVGTAPKPLTVTLGSAAQAQGAGRDSPVLSQSAPPAAAPFAAYEAAAGAATPRSTAIAGMHPIWNQADEVAQVLTRDGAGPGCTALTDEEGAYIALDHSRRFPSKSRSSASWALATSSPAS